MNYGTTLAAAGATPAVLAFTGFNTAWEVMAGLTALGLGVAIKILAPKRKSKVL
jgi:hypothetical protein